MFLVPFFLVLFTRNALAEKCVFCTKDVTYDLSSLPNTTFTLNGTTGADEFYATTPCGSAISDACRGEGTSDPASQGCSRGLGTLGITPIVTPIPGQGLNITLLGGSNNPPCGKGPGGNRTLVYRFICDKSAPQDNPPDPVVVESPGCTYIVSWHHPSVCESVPTPSGQCQRPGPPPPPPYVCKTCLPTWKPTWDMMRSTVLYTCNDTGMHDVNEAIRYGLVVYDWSNAKQIWANEHPMNDEELLTKQAEMVLAASPSIPGEQPRVWVYRNTIKALNWYSSVREKLDDPQYSGWFVKFKDYKGPQSNNSYHVPACTWYNVPTMKCSGFYHDQAQSPNHPGGGPAYKVDGACIEQCDCGKNPCGEYTFDHRNESFADWFINEYMISNETLHHNPPIGLGWLDDSMTLQGMTEGAPYPTWVEDTGSSPQDMQDHVNAYHRNMANLANKLVPMGGFYWQLMKSSGPQVRPTPGHGRKPPHNVTSDQCKSILRDYCVPNPNAWQYAAHYECEPSESLRASNSRVSTDQRVIPSSIPFCGYIYSLNTYRDYAWLGYGWVGCGSDVRPRPKEWDMDFGGKPDKPCSETGNDTGVFSREYPKATVSWDCNTGMGSIKMKDEK
eukprot:m.277463 g.277463  ORF g.277463 m.277463 type:complete len:615 (+) comp16307_c0_seq7:50-1894(+)